MNTVPKLLAENITVLKNQRVVQLAGTPNGWQLSTETGDIFHTKKLLVTMPAPQAVQLLENSQIELTDSPLPNISYAPCLVVLAKLDQVSGIPAPGGIKTNGTVIEWMADNFQKGISKTPSLTIHANSDFSVQHLDGDLRAAGRLMLESAAALIAPAKVTDWRVHRWRYSLCTQRHTDSYWQADTKWPLIFGGDGFGIGNVEGGFLSGRAMADCLLEN